MPDPKAEALRLQTIAKKMPKQDNLVICVGRDEGMFVDNAKHLFLHMLRHEPDIETHFLTFMESEHAKLTAAGLPSLLFSPDCIPLLAKARAVVADDSAVRIGPAWPIFEKSFFLQIWHGIPLKKIGFPEILSGPPKSQQDIADLEAVYSSGDAVVSTSPFFTENAFSKAFRVETFIETGYPRNDSLLRTPDRFDLINVDVAIFEAISNHRARGGKVAFYMPTFRDSGTNALGMLNLEQLVPFLKENDVLFVAKLHPCLMAPSGKLTDNVFICDSQTDAYPLLTQTDVLITDYSSIYFDFLLTDKPMVFFAPDLDQYREKDRGMFFDYDEFTPGPKTSNTEALLQAMKHELKTDGTDWADRRHEMTEKCFSDRDGNAASRIMDFLRKNVLAS